jgi:sialate O-acetylesterase
MLNRPSQIPMKKNIKIISPLLCLTCVVGASAQSSVTNFQVNSLFHDNAILQRETRLPVWGTAADDEKIVVEFAGQKLKTVVKNGVWKVWLKPMPANASPQTMSIQQGETTLTFTNVLVGDVWVVSGQSNMQAMLREGVEGWEEAVAEANYPQIHQ